MAVQVAQHAVVVENGHLLLGQQHGEEIAVLDAAGLGHAQRRRRTVVAVGDVERRQGVDRAGQRLDRRFVVDHPEFMAHAIVGGHVDRRRSGRGALQQRVDRGASG